MTTAVWAQRVHRWTYQPPKTQMHELAQLVKKWLQPEKLTGPQILERVVMDQYLPSLLNDLQCYNNPTTAEQLVEVVQIYTMVEDLLGPAKCQGPFLRVARPTDPPRKEALPNPETCVRPHLPWRSIPVRRIGDIQCWWDQSWGSVPTPRGTHRVPGWQESLLLSPKNVCHSSEPGRKLV